MTQIRINRTTDSETSLTVGTDAALTLIRSRLVNYKAPFVVSVGDEDETFDDCGAAVARAIEAIADSPSVSVYPLSKPSAGWDLYQASPQKTQEEAMAHMEVEDELMPETET